MSGTIFMSVASLGYIIMLMIVVFKKHWNNTSENKIFVKLIMISFMSLISEIYITMLPANINFKPFVISMKIYLLFLILWVSKFMEYVFIITRNNKNRVKIDYAKKYKKIRYIFTICTLLIMFLSYKLPIYFFNENGMKYSYGPSVNVVFILTGFYSLVMWFYIIKNFKHLKEKEYLPIIVLVLLLLATVVVQKINPSFLIANTSFAMITVLMYFTIENPDMKLLEELAVNKNLLQHSNEEKSNLLFKLTQDVKLPVENICNTSKDMLNMKKVIDLKNNSKLINDDANRVRFIINNVLNINDIDYNKIKVFNDTYDINKLYKELILMIKNKINKEVKLNTKIDKDIPILYGDNIKLKQILYSILSNSIKYTKQGNIEFNINHFIQYDVCRLIININDTGCGIDIDKINKVLNDEETDIKSNGIELELNSVKKLINILGGSIFIDSNKLGIKVSIVLDQRIYETEEIKHNKELNNYIKYIGTEKNVLLIDDNYEELNKYAKEIKKYNINVDKSMYGKDILNKIRNKIKYDLIIIDDEMNPYNAVTIMEELNKEENFKTKVIIMIGINKEFIKEHYIKDYKFKDYIIKRNYKTEIERIINKYL